MMVMLPFAGIFPAAVGLLLLTTNAGVAEDLPARPLAASTTVIDETAGPLSLVTTFPSAMENMSPGDSMDWTITPMLSGGLSGTLTVRVVSEGKLAEHDQGASLMLRQCPGPWESGTCPGQSHTVLEGTLRSLDSDAVHAAGRITGTTGTYLLATISVPDSMPDDLQSSRLAVGLGFTAMGDEELAASRPPAMSEPGNLPDTGGGPFLPFLIVGMAALLIGASIRLRAGCGG